jgi:hypothetical protein
MSLYKDASLVMIPSAVKDGKLYSIRPVPEYGAEEVTNGDFATDSNWTKETGWTISGGKASYNGSAATNALYQNISAVSGTTYRVSFSVVNYVSGSFKAFLSNGSATGSSPLITANGDYVFDMTATGILLVFRNDTSFNGSIDNVSVQEIVSSGDFTFSRGSNLAATRVDVNGLIEKGRENRLLQSNSFSTSPWTGNNSGVTGGQAGYDGTNDAWKHNASGGYSYRGQSLSSNGVQTFSVYAKAGSVPCVRLYTTGSASLAANFDLSNGSIINHQGIDANIESVGNGWYRCSITFNANSTFIYIYAANAGGNIATTITGDNIYIQDAQLEQGLVATDYIETGASTAQAGILEDLPRLDYSGGASCPSLLLEPQRSNLIVYSEYLSSSAYFKTGTTITDNYGISPEGVQNSSLFNFGATGSSSNFGETLAGLTAGTSITYTIYVKGSGTIRIYSDGNGSGGYFFYSTNITLTNEWVRQELTYTIPAGVSVANFVIQRQTNDTATQAEFYGFQVESGSYPTSYIPTYGGSAVTRSLDVSDSSENSVLFNKAQGVLFFEGKALAEGTDRRISISDGTLNNYVSIGYSRFTGNIVAEIIANGVSQQPNWGATGVTQTDNNKFALSWGNGTIKFYMNGVLKLTESGTSPTGLDILRFSAGNSSLRFSGNLNQLLVFPTALTDSECIALTTI